VEGEEEEGREWVHRRGGGGGGTGWRVGAPSGWRWRRNRVEIGGAAGVEVEVEWRRKLCAFWFVCVE
jgi:hypothetical protein